jgi:membrane-associated protease RseP (regulator of RpoE activity)
MTRNKLLLTLSLVFSCGLIAGGIAYAQGEAVAPEPDVLVAPQEPGTGLMGREFSLFVDGGSFLGVHAEEIDKENMQRYGLREVRGVGVTEIVKDSPAEKAGLRKDDVIVRFEGDSVTSVRKLSRLVSEVAPEHTVRLTIVRGGAEQELSVTLAKRDNAEKIFGTMKSPEIFRNFPRGDMKIDPGLIQINPGQDGFVFAFGGNRRIGISTQPLTKQLADYFGVKDGGLLITSVNEDSPAAKAGLKAGDIITAVDGEKVESSGDVARAINKKEDGDVTLTIVRDRNTRTINVTPEKKTAPAVVRPSGTSARRVVIPQVDLPTIPEINIQLPRIMLPSIPQIEVTVPRVVKGPRRVVI